MTDLSSDHGPFDDLPGDLMIWVLIVSELLVFGAGLAAFLAVRATDPAGFASAQAALHPAAAALNTAVLVTSGFAAALATWASEAERPAAGRLWLGAAMAFGVVFLVVKGFEYADLAQQGIGVESHAAFTFYYLLTGFHAAHVAAGVLILGLVAIRLRPYPVETAAAFWHMVDLVWVLLFPVIYLMG
ncbi:cytochrome c oxidase subunit 3 [Defluviimonas sp. D31]|uniref:cytochrome c oxidase subunit 3 n=1 Tax=Defluviimonas sp. D31 TaxID=3083253 RepID=UPI00296F0430|nr:cytochrome c oxidase subunit 3 [Defluviimonas sp. D31]MDW4550742.1 cytochrome c oxidase subunit 3 [Defluviimonas sp. D31]